MTSWLDYIDRARSVTAIFGNTVPSTEGLTLIEIRLDYERPTVFLRFDLVDFPENPPAKWAQGQANRVQLEIAAAVIEDLRIEGLCLNPVFDLSIRQSQTPKDDERAQLGISLRGPGVNVRFAAQYLYVTKISAYLEAGE